MMVVPNIEALYKFCIYGTLLNFARASPAQQLREKSELLFLFLEKFKKVFHNKNVHLCAFLPVEA